MHCNQSSHLQAAVALSVVQFDLAAELRSSAWKVQKGVATTKLHLPDGSLVDKTGKAVFCSIAAIELSLIFKEGVRRFTLRPPSGRDRARAMIAFVENWLALIKAEKARQLQLLKDSEPLPALPAEWGEVQHAACMPCVIWLVVPQHV